MDPIMTIIIAIVTLIIGAAVGYFLSKKSVDKQNQELIDEATRKAQNLINDAEKDGEAIKKEKIFQAKEKFLELSPKAEELKIKISKLILKIEEDINKKKIDK